MADLVLGLAKTSVEGTLSMAKTAMEEEEKVHKGLRRDLVLISDEFEMMQSFLKVAGEQHQTTASNHMTTTLVRQVRKVATDAEDCIESVMHLAGKSSRWWLRLLPSFLPPAAPLATLNKVVADVELLKNRIEAMGQRNTRYNRINDHGSSSSSSKQVQKLEEPDRGAAYYVLPKLRSTAAAANLTELVTRKSVVSVWGTGGDLGMTPIIKEAYEHKHICDEFVRAWVKLPCPFNRHEFLRSLLVQLCTSYTPQQVKKMEAMTEGELLDMLMSNTDDNGYLVVLENLSGMDVWRIVCDYLSNCSNKHSCIVVHTQSFEIASSCVGYPCQVSELKQFSDDHSVCVLYKEDGEKYKVMANKNPEHVSLEASKPVGRQTELGKLFLAVAATETKKRVMSVWGIAGVGKSYMVKCWLDDKKFCEGPLKDFKKYGWVDVSHPFNLRDFSWRLLLDLYSDSIPYRSLLGSKDSVQQCRNFLSKYSCLIVIDGLQSIEEWDLIKDSLVTGDFSGFIIVITNEKDIAEYCAKSVLFNVKSLEVEEAIDLFKKKVYHTMDHETSVKEKHIIDNYAQEIIPKCGGLPKVIIAVAGFLKLTTSANKRSSKSLETRCLKLRDEFMSEMEKKTTLQDLFTWVHSYFRKCPDFLKPCIFYLSIFHSSHIIRRRRLVRRWIAEGYSRATKERTTEEKSEEFMSNLIELCMIQPLEVTASMVSFHVGKPLCQVNGFFREYIMSKSMEENLVFELKGRCRMSLERTGQHLAIQSNWHRDQNVFESIDASRLRSLTVFGEWRPFFISDKMRVLRVLDLEGTTGIRDKELEELLRLLPPLLRFLSLRGCREVTHLSYSLARLRQLQTLDVRNTSVLALPLAISKLQKLEYVRAGPTVSYSDDKGTVEIQPPLIPPRSKPCASSSCFVPKFFRQHAYMSGGVKVPIGVNIGKLSALHTLGVVHISTSFAGEAIMLEDLKKLTQLHKLGVCGVNQRNGQKLLSTISGHGHLQSLSIQLDEDNQDGCLETITTPPEMLQSLKLYGLLCKLPVWVKGLLNLKKLKLQVPAILQQDEIDILGTLPKLQILCLWLKEFQYGKLQFRSGFTELFVLEIACNSSSKEVSFQGKRTMESLEMLKIRCSGSVLQLQFSGLQERPELTDVWLSGTYDCTFKERLECQLAHHKKKPCVKDWKPGYSS